VSITKKKQREREGPVLCPWRWNGTR